MAIGIAPDDGGFPDKGIPPKNQPPKRPQLWLLGKLVARFKAWRIRQEMGLDKPANDN